MNKENIKKVVLAYSGGLDELTAEIEEGNGEVKGQVIVTGDVYPGTKIVIEDVSMVVKGAMKYCRFIKEEGEVKMAAIY